MLFSKIVRIFVKIFMYISIAAVSLLLGLTVADVFLRLVFKAPITGVIEISQVLLVSIMASMGAVIIEKRNIEVRVVVEAVSPKVALGMEIVTLLMSIGYFFLVGWQTLESVKFSLQFNIVYSMLRLPQWPFMLLLGASFTVCGFAAVVYLMNRVAARNQVAVADKTGISDNPELGILKGHD